MTDRPMTLTAQDCDKLLQHIWNHPVSELKKPKRIRNFCMALLMLDAGLRVGEVVKLTRDDLYFLNEPRYTLLVQAIFSKSKTDRTIPLSVRIRKAIEALQVSFWSRRPEPRFVWAFTTWSTDESLSVRHLERIIRRSSMASLGRAVHPHILRHTFASRLLRSANLRTVQELLGHVHLSSTQIYTHPNADDLKRAIESLEGENIPADPQ